MEALSEQLNALYEDPTKLETIQDPRLRLRAAAFINQVGAGSGLPSCAGLAGGSLDLKGVPVAGFAPSKGQGHTGKGAGRG